MGSEPSPPPGAKPPALRSRNGNNFSATFPEIVDGLRSVLDHREDVLDGEIVALGPSSVCRDRRVTDGRVAPADADKWCCC